MSISAVALTQVLFQQSFGQTIVGTAHDFSAEAWNTYEYGAGVGGDQICKVCHTPHNASLIGDQKPLWNHTATTAVYTLYSNSTFNGSATITQPDGASKLCLSCHDGTVAVDQFNPVNTSTNFIAGAGNIGTDLSNDHPVSFDYSSNLAATDGGLFDPTITPSGLGNTISTDMLFNNKLQCASCHNAHDNSNGKFLRKSNTNSALCLTCHDK
ncbi:MAG: cytochrome c3 family protein [Bacteroidetes bacterium]|nr:cytochrome c3 family protein [Bacteroidota bacterium]